MKNAITFFIVFFFFIDLSAQKLVQPGNYDSYLYYGCGNKLDIRLPDQKEGEKVNYSASGALLILSEEDLVILVPNTNKVVLNVLHENGKAHKFIFKAKETPRPALKAVFMGDTLTNHQILTSLVGRIYLELVPDPDFVKDVPDDAQYITESWYVELINGEEKLYESYIQGSNFDLSEIASLASSGNTLRFTGQNTYRIDFRDFFAERFNPFTLSLKIQ